MELRKKRVLVVGLARTGVATALFCARHNAIVSATETRNESELGDAPAKLREAGVAMEFGGHTEKMILGQDLIIPSPGVPADDPFLKLARSKGITVWSEIELAYRFLEGKLIGITGSNGKTTTTTLVHHLLKAGAKDAYLAGNVGTPLIGEFRPNIGALLNLTPDHLDRHKTMEAYAAAKARIFENQTELDAAILNADDAASAKYAPKKPQVFWFSRLERVPQGACLNGDAIVIVHHGEEDRVMNAAEIPLAGAHNLENVLAAVLMARLAGVDTATIEIGRAH